MSVLLVLAGFLVLIAAGCGFGYIYIRRLYREQKNYERGLKMVPLLIHLPPLSDDTDTQGRDARDVVNENISRAMTLYSILASTFQKGFKAKFYGQRHVALEIVASKGFIHFYAAVPVPLMSVVEQAIISAYPTAKLEEVAEHNIFSPVGRITGTQGGEMVLKENYVYPIATYEDIKRDTMQSLLNSLSTLDKDDGAGVQILLRPAHDGWRKTATDEARRKREGKTKATGIEAALGSVGQMITALTKPPDSMGEGKEEKPHEISSLDQSLIEAIENKTRQPAYEVKIRLVSSSNLTHRAQTILNNMVATFSLFDAPGKNGFKFVPAKDIDSFVTAYILRFFPQESTRNILNATELATMFHFPDQQNIPTSQLERQPSKQVDGPRNVPEEGMLLGYNMFRGAKKAIRLSEQDRARHMYIVGQTGTGKSVFMENLALQDMLEGRGFAFVDPHGDTAERLLSMVPKERTEDVIYFSPADMDYPLGLNMFEFSSPDQRDFLIQEAINMLYKLYDPTHSGIIGPRYEHIFRNAALTVMADPAGGTFVDIPKLFRDNEFVEQKLKHVTDQTVIDFWRKEIPQSQRSNEYGEVTSWFVSKFGAFLSNEMMRNIIGQTKSAFNLRQVMDEGKILLVNLSRGRTGDLNSKLLGMIFVMKFEAAAMSRADMPEEQRRDFCLYVDEFQNFATDSFADILSQARKYHLNLIVANQFSTQLKEEVRDAVFGNVGSLVCFRVGTTDAEFLAKQFAPIFEIDDLQFLPNYNTAVRIMIGGVPVQPFSMATLPPLGNPNQQLSNALKQLSAAKYGRPKATVDSEISKRLATQPRKPSLPPGGSRFGVTPGVEGTSMWDELGLPAPKSGAAGAFPPAAPAGRPQSSALPPSMPKPVSSGSSFLDEWLAKRKIEAGESPAVPQPQVQHFAQPAAVPSTPWASSSTGPSEPAVSARSVEPAAPNPKSIKESEKQSEPEPQPAAMPKVDTGEFKIKRDENGEAQPHEHTIRIDKEGNISYEE
ncbi:MAG TPA: ATP-binding protein [Candidatus Saccharimonadales bacterium]|nr:ATP-binding protein [Candidatus Saccharimonadales bacterium]